MGAVSNYRRSIGGQQAPLRELFFDDAASFWQFQNWNPLDARGWPGGARQNTLTFCDAVHPGDTVAFTTKRFYTTGSRQEGLVLLWVNESGGPLSVYLDGQLLITIGDQSYYDRVLTDEVIYDMRRVGFDGGGKLYGNSNEDFTTTPTFSRGWHTVTVVKEVNAQVGDNNPGGRRTYFDGGRLYTHSTQLF
jgi:hypothetical protein